MHKINQNGTNCKSKHKCISIYYKGKQINTKEPLTTHWLI